MVVCVIGAEAELGSVFPVSVAGWLGGEVVFKSAMTRCKEDKASLESGAGGATVPGLLEDWPLLLRLF